MSGRLPLRSLLFAPGESARKAEKAIASAADAVILDLEDSVAAANKAQARAQTAALLRTRPSRTLIVRVNARATPHYLPDLAAVMPVAPAAIMLPKCVGATDLAILDHHLEALETAAGIAVGSTGILAIVTETAASVLALPTLAALGPGSGRRLQALCFGAEDLAADLGIAPRNASFAYPAPVAAARAAVLTIAGAIGVPALDTPWPDPGDTDGLLREALAAAADGFSGKLLIHPAQIAPVHSVFTPSPERRAWARAVRDAFAANPEAGVLSLDGRMVDRPHLRLAEKILAAP